MSATAQLYYQICTTRAGQRAARAALSASRSLGALRSFEMPLDALYLPHQAARQLMRLWRRVHWSSGDGMMPPKQLMATYRLAALWPVEGDIVELGAWTGLTTCYLAAACEARGSGRVYAVDTFAGTKEHGERYASIEQYGGSTLNAFTERLRTAGLDHRVETMVGYTGEMAKGYAGRAIRMLLIDADHSFEGVRGDFQRWSPHVAPRGVIVFHDYLMDDVARFVEECVVPDPRFAAAPGQVLPNIFAVTKRLTAEAFHADACPDGRVERIGAAHASD